MQNSHTNTTMEERNAVNNTIHSPSSSGAYHKRSKHPQPSLNVPPGYVAFRLLCHVSCIGGLIGKPGSFIEHIQKLTNSKIRVDDPSDLGDNKIVVVISSRNLVNKIRLSSEDESNGGGLIDVSAAQDGLLRIFERVVEMAADGDDVAAIGGLVSCRLLLWKNEGGTIIGKGGEIVEKIKKDTRTRIYVLRDEFVEIEGDILAVKKALIAVTSLLQEFSPFDKTSTYISRPLEAEPLPIPTVDPPMPANSINRVPIDGHSSLKKVLCIYSKTRQQKVVFKLLCCKERVGDIIGREGSIINAIENETGASITIGPVLPDCNEQLVTVSAMESAQSKHSPAQNAVALVFCRSMAGPIGWPITARLVVSYNQVGCLLGIGGAVIAEMRKVTGAGLVLLNHVPKCASKSYGVFQITGEFVNVRDALYYVTGRLRDMIFSIKMSNGNGNHNPMGTENRVYGNVRDTTSVRSHLSNEHKSLNEDMGRLRISNNVNPSLLESPTISRANREYGVDDNSRILASVKGGVELGSGNRSAIVRNTTLEIVVSDAVFGFIHGEDDSNFARLQEISGAKVTILEPNPGTSERTLVISGTPDATQAAQSMLQTFILAGS